MSGFGHRLTEEIERHGALCVGIDPHASLLKAWGLGQDVAGLREFSRRCVEAFAGHVALVKPQVAFYERFGSLGFAVLEETIGQLRAAGTLVVADAKRGDIGSTMAGYAEAWLGEGSPLQSDAVTVSPYLGVGALNAVFAQSKENGAGVFVLAATSNPEAVEVQSSTDEHGRTVAQRIIDECAAHNPNGRIGDIGVVVGATVAQAPDLKALNGPVLMPGVGAQGGSAADVERIAAGALAVPNVSRSVLSAGPDVAALRAAAVEVASGYRRKSI